MKEEFKQEYLRIGVLTSIVEKMDEKFLGSTKMQKLVYLAQELYDIPLGYRFIIYNYGPYSFELANEVENLEYQGIVKVVCEGDNCWINRSSTKLPLIADDNRKGFEKEIDELLKQWGEFNAKDLELYTTFIYVDKENYNNKVEINQDELIKKVGEIKPKQRNRCAETFQLLEKLYNFKAVKK